MITEFPDRIYTVNQQGNLHVRVRLNPANLKNCSSVEKFGMPYEEILMIGFPSDEGWRLIDYEAKIADKSRAVFYSQLSIKCIDDHINGTAMYQYSTVWTEDLEYAISLSKERYSKHHPTGKAYDVVSYWDDCDRRVVNGEPLLWSEAQELCKKYRDKLRPGSLYYYGVEVHREKNHEAENKD